MAIERIYEPLNKELKQIRVLNLFGPAEDGLVHAELEVISLLSSTRPAYEAVSYCWGEVSGKARLILNSIPFDAPAAAVKVLHQFQPKSAQEQRVLWIDAVCINQEDIVERAQQVELMGDVYRSCSSALVWLGDYDSNVEEFIESMNILLDDCRARTNNLEIFWPLFDGDIDLKGTGAILHGNFSAAAFYKFLQRKWFTRLWVLQEVTMASSATCWCGGISIPWTDICISTVWLGLVQEPNNDPANAVMLMIASMTVSGKRPGGDRISIRVLLGASALLNCSEPLDKVYAILGLSRTHFGDNPWLDTLRADYTQPVGHAFATMTKAAIYREQNLDALDMCDDGRPFEDAPDGSKLPSWAMKLHGYDLYGHLSSFMGRFRASYDTPLGRVTPSRSATLEKLVLEGLKVDYVTSVMHIDQPRTTRGEFRSVFKKALEFIKGINGLTDYDLAKTMVADTSVVNDTVLTHTPREEEDFQIALRAFLGTEDFDDEPLKDPHQWLNENISERGVLDFPSFAHYKSRHTCLFRTEKGFIGLGPKITEPGDIVAVLFGGRVPYILRSTQSEQSGASQSTILDGTRSRLGWTQFGAKMRNFFRREVSPNQECAFIGTSYVHGIMFGEAVKEHRSSGKPSTIFELI